MKFSFVNLFFSCFEGKKFHYIVIKINENHIYRFINNTGKIKLRDIHSKDGITEITFNYKDKNKILDIAEKMGIKILDIKEKGTYTYITRLPVVKSVTFILAVFTLLLIINSHFIWNIDVEGNYSYTSTQIMRFLKKMDIKEGMRKNRINSDEIEKEIRRKYNDISWVCAEVKGTNLIVHIKENYITEISAKEDKTYDLIANRDCTIKSILVRKGKGVVKAGDKVKKGDVLISGIVDVFNESGEKIFTKLCNADGDVVGITNLSYNDKISDTYFVKNIKHKRTYYAPLVAGYTWNIKENDKNETVVKSERNFKAFGNFYLPFGMEKYVVTKFEKEKRNYTKEEAKKKLYDRFNYKMSILEQKGYKILEKNVKIDKKKNHYVFSGTIKCLEPLGKVSYIESEKISEIESENNKETTKSD